ncbi:MAG: endonuclease/exonuclease/phosphatase family protein, partial [Microgenomates group bacterium]
ATFYRASLFTLQRTKSFNLPSSVIQMITFLLKNRTNPRTVLRTDFIIKKNRIPVCTYNIHFSPNATNSLRIKQLNNTLSDLTVPKKSPLIIAGDFNYPYGRRKLEDILSKHHLHEATNNIFYTSRQTFFKKFAIKLKLDYVFYRNLKLISNKRVEVFHSDHFPILSKFEV